ncbi:MAG: M23 family metallopeptidase [Lysobacteraceae bacterium]|nr:MAG: M23 family metallopeptidase [Xanthomonadaceae bacterium]
MTTRRPRLAPVLAAALLLAASAIAAPAPSVPAWPRAVPQGSLVVAHVEPGSRVTFGGRDLRVTARGEVVFGIGRDARGPAEVDVRHADGTPERIAIEVVAREWPTERVVGVPPKTVEPPPEVAERIRREQARVVAARARDDARSDFLARFTWPLQGRISGRFGNQRVYVVDGHDVPKSPHSGMDIAAPEGTPVKAPAGGIVTFVDADLYLTGGTLLIDHGHGVSSNFLHLLRIDVKAGDRVEQGEVIGAVGKTGRASGPHLHWGLNWFDTRLDPLLLLARD